MGRPLNRDVLFVYSFGSSSYQLGCTVATVSAQQPVEHVKNSLQNITTDWTPHRVHKMWVEVQRYPANCERHGWKSPMLLVHSLQIWQPCSSEPSPQPSLPEQTTSRARQLPFLHRNGHPPPIPPLRDEKILLKNVANGFGWQSCNGMGSSTVIMDMPVKDL